jgi:hypothetical protein
VNRNAWSAEERDEFDETLALVVGSADPTGERVDRMEQLVAGAVQAHRTWAVDVEREARRIGFASLIKAYLKRTRVVFLNREAMVDKPRVVGFKRTSTDGVVYDVQALLETATFDELRAKRREAIRTMRSYRDSIALFDALLTLAEIYPDAATVAEALVAHGMSLDDFLTLPAAA